MSSIFSPADILLPKAKYMENFSVVACDQYTSEPQYWDDVAATVGDAPSALRMIVPEHALGGDDVAARIAASGEQMANYLRDDVFDEVKNSYIYVERTLKSGLVRRGVVGKIDLVAYDYAPGSSSPVRATEATVLERIPPRVAVREGAPIESPHIMVLLDDRSDSVVSAAQKSKAGELLYDFPLMQSSGALRGWRVDESTAAEIDSAIDALSGASIKEKYGVDAPPLVFAVGDGNHSLATAKECYRRLCEQHGAAAMENHPARYALVELVNLHESSLLFEPVHRIVFDVDCKKLVDAMTVELGGEGEQRFAIVKNGYLSPFTLGHPTHSMAVGSLQFFLDDYISRFGGRCDYIHGDSVVGELSKTPNAIGFLLPPVDKNSLFSTVMLDGCLTRKTFSMGHACDKRFYLECRRIK